MPCAPRRPLVVHAPSLRRPARRRCDQHVRWALARAEVRAAERAGRGAAPLAVRILHWHPAGDRGDAVLEVSFGLWRARGIREDKVACAGCLHLHRMPCAVDAPVRLCLPAVPLRADARPRREPRGADCRRQHPVVRLVCFLERRPGAEAVFGDSSLQCACRSAPSRPHARVHAVPSAFRLFRRTGGGSRRERRRGALCAAQASRPRRQGRSISQGGWTRDGAVRHSVSRPDGFHEPLQFRGSACHPAQALRFRVRRILHDLPFHGHILLPRFGVRRFPVPHGGRAEGEFLRRAQNAGAFRRRDGRQRSRRRGSARLLRRLADGADGGVAPIQIYVRIYAIYLLPECPDDGVRLLHLL